MGRYIDREELSKWIGKLVAFGIARRLFAIVCDRFVACACEVVAPHVFGARLLARRWIAGCDSATERRSATPASCALLPAGCWASDLGLSLPLIRRGGRGARSCARSACVPTCASAACVYWAHNLLHLGVPKRAEEDGVYLVFLVCVCYSF